jgi:serine phosphatase RsbU (regulator of sigma subunit)
MPDASFEQHTSNLCVRVSAHLTRTLNDAPSLNEFLERALPPIAGLFGTSRTMLIDYHENTHHFDLLHFCGFSESSRFELQQRLRALDLARALNQKEPFIDIAAPGLLYIPLYYTETLEALLLLESPEPVVLTLENHEVLLTISKFLGLVMSSGRLSINQAGLIDVSDLQKARQIQLSYLPSGKLSTDQYEVYGYNQSSAFVGGDYFDYFQMRGGSLQCILADACGHGLSAALIMSTFRALLHSEVSRQMEPRLPGKVFDAINQSVYAGGSILQYLTGVFLDYDESAKRMRYTNAGHFEPLLVRTTGSVEDLPGGGPPLGMFKQSSYPTYESETKSGDLLVLFTDGLVDLRDPQDEFFGQERIRRAVTDQRARPLTEIASFLLTEGMAFSAAPHPEDDLTLFLVRFL